MLQCSQPDANAVLNANAVQNVNAVLEAECCCIALRSSHIPQVSSLKAQGSTLNALRSMLYAQCSAKCFMLNTQIFNAHLRGKVLTLGGDCIQGNLLQTQSKGFQGSLHHRKLQQHNVHDLEHLAELEAEDEAAHQLRLHHYTQAHSHASSEAHPEPSHHHNQPADSSSHFDAPDSPSHSHSHAADSTSYNHAHAADSTSHNDAADSTSHNDADGSIGQSHSHSADNTRLNHAHVSDSRSHNHSADSTRSSHSHAADSTTHSQNYTSDNTSDNNAADSTSHSYQNQHSAQDQQDAQAPHDDDDDANRPESYFTAPTVDHILFPNSPNRTENDTEWHSIHQSFVDTLATGQVGQKLLSQQVRRSMHFTADQ